jgi:raffinose/stachyose/melibiose transport system substrate-binding protein
LLAKGAAAEVHPATTQQGDIVMRRKANLASAALILSTLAAAAPASAGDIVYWSMWNDQEPSAKQITALAQQYMAAHPDTKIHITFNGRQNQVKARTALTGGTTIDLIDGELDNLAGGLVAAGQTEPFDALLASAGPDGETKFADLFLPSALDVAKHNGVVYQIPYDYNPYAFYYNRKMWSDAGVKERPKTWDELLAALEKVKAAGHNGLAVESDAGVYNIKYLTYMLERTLGPDFLMKAVEDKTGETWKHPAVLAAMKNLRVLWDKGYVPAESKGYQWPAAQQTVALGDTSAELVGSWLPIELADTAGPDFQWGTFPFPTVAGKGDPSHVEVLLVSYVLLKDSKVKPEAEDFIKFMLSKGSQQAYSANALRPAVNKSVVWPKPLSDAHAIATGATLVMAEDDGVKAKYPDYVSNILEAVTNKAFLGDLTPEQFVDELSSRTKTYWASK